MCKILAVVVAFLWAFANSTFLGHDLLATACLDVQFKKTATHSIVIPKSSRHYLRVG